MKDKTKQSRASQLLEKFERARPRAAQSAEEILLNEIRIRQKMLDPEKFSSRKVTVK